jgi:hypothetical protein
MNNLDNISDDELDKIFREASEDGFPDNLQNEWSIMSERLDREIPQPSLWTKFRSVFFALLLLIPTSLIYFGGKSNQSVLNKNENRKSEISNQKEISSNSLTAKNTTKSSIEGSKNEQSEKSDFGIQKSTEKNADGTLKNANANTLRKMPSFAQKLVETCGGTFENKDVNAISTSENPQKAFTKIAKQSNANENAQSISKTERESKEIRLINEDLNYSKKSNPTEIANTETQNETNDLLTNTNASIFENRSTESIANLEVPVSRPILFDVEPLAGFFGPFLISDNVKQDSILNPNIVIEKEAEKPTSADYFKKGFYGQIGYSPDISLVSEFEKDVAWGNNQAFLLNYRFSQKWSIQSGVIKSVKNYSAYPADYKWVWKNVNTPLKEIDAVCKMIDIPVNVRFDFKSSHRRKFFGSTGLTSYLMQKETYKYFYENDADPSIKWRQWNGKTGFYAAGVINFSTGLEYKLTKKLSFQIEPFAKIPIRQIGFGKVKLSTYGVLVSANYPLRN